MRILQLVQKPQRRGAELFATQLAAALRRQGEYVRLAYLYPHVGEDALALGSDDVLLDGAEAHPLERAAGVHPGLLQRVLRLVDAVQPDIVQANGARTVKYGALARRLRPRAAWRLVYRNIGNPRDWVRTPAHRLFYRRVVMPAVDGVVGVSQTTLAGALAFYAIDKPHALIGGGIDPDLPAQSASRAEVRGRAGVAMDALLLVTVGSLSPEKRVDRLLRLVARLRAEFPALRCWVVGDGPLRGALEAQAEALEIAGVVRFWGAQARVGDFLAAADVFVLASDTEGLPGALLEAGYMGLPAAATAVGGVGECVVHGETGLLVAAQDEDALAQAAGRLLRDPDARRAMGAAAHERVKAHYLIDAVAAQYSDFYALLLSATES